MLYLLITFLGKNDFLNSKRNKILILTISLVLLIPVSLLALTIGRYQLLITDVYQAIVNPQTNPLITNLIFNVRLPRIFGALLIGAALSMAGLVFQDIFANNLVSPDLLGVANGASVGAGLAIILGLSLWTMQLWAFIGGIIAVSLTLAIPYLLKNNTRLILLLAGIVVSGFMQAIFGLIKYLADPDSQLQSIVYWQLGSLTKIDLKNITLILPAFLLAFLILLVLRWHLTILSLGDQSAETSGINVRAERLLFIICATILTASSVCLAGTIGWIGLIIPHLARHLIGGNSRYSLSMAGIIGAYFLLVIDTLARTISNAEIPLSILTGFIGTPIFIYILVKKGGKNGTVNN